MLWLFLFHFADFCFKMVFKKESCKNPNTKFKKFLKRNPVRISGTSCISRLSNIWCERRCCFSAAGQRQCCPELWALPNFCMSVLHHNHVSVHEIRISWDPLAEERGSLSFSPASCCQTWHFLAFEDLGGASVAPPDLLHFLPLDPITSIIILGSCVARGRWPWWFAHWTLTPCKSFPWDLWRPWVLLSFKFLKSLNIYYTWS